MSEENKNYFLESVTSAATLWCNKAITSDDLLRIIRKTVDETEKRIKIDPESWAVYVTPARPGILYVLQP